MADDQTSPLEVDPLGMSGKPVGLGQDAWDIGPRKTRGPARPQHHAPGAPDTEDDTADPNGQARIRERPAAEGAAGRRFP